MKFDYLKEFIEVAYCRSYSKAAKNLDTSQSSISKHVQLIEAQYGFLLFERDTSNVALTPFGAAFLQEAITLLDANERFETEVARLCELYKKSLAIGGMYYNPKVMRLLKEACRVDDSPQVFIPLEYKKSLTDPLVDNLIMGKIDAAVAPNSDALAENEALHLVKLFDEPLFALMDEGHVLATREDVSIAELCEWTILKPTGSYYVLGNEKVGKLIKDNSKRSSERAVLIKDTPDFFSINFADDVTIVEEGVAAMLPPNSGIAHVPISDRQAVFSLVAICRSDNMRAVTFIDRLASCSSAAR